MLTIVVSRSVVTAPRTRTRLMRFSQLGLLDAPDPRLAADHFSALTTLLAYNNQPDRAEADLDRVRQTMIDGVHAFVRAYEPRP
jgi:TetR/AcrR family transcriptional regulator, mexJK operon transcriptional repressor